MKPAFVVSYVFYREQQPDINEESFFGSMVFNADSVSDAEEVGLALIRKNHPESEYYRGHQTNACEIPKEELDRLIRGEVLQP